MDFERIDIGAQVVARHAGGRFDPQDVFGGQALAGLDPFPDGSGRDIAMPSKGGLRASAFDGFLQRFVRGGVFNHG